MSLNPARIAYVDILRRMGAAIDVDVTGDEIGEPVGDLHVTAAPLHGADIAGDESIIDELPVLAVAAAFAEGETVVHDAAELAVKESNRIGTVEQELTQLGIAGRGAARRLGDPGRRARRRRPEEPRRPPHRDGRRRRRARPRAGPPPCAASARPRCRTRASPPTSPRCSHECT